MELIAAAGLVPYRMVGSIREPITEADAYIDGIACPYVRSCFDLAIKGAYDFCDGLVIPHACDSISRTYDIWKSELKFSGLHPYDWTEEVRRIWQDLCIFSRVMV